MIEEIRGTASNENKMTLVKDGYDIFCPNTKCLNHFELGHLSHDVTCPKCRLRWRVDSRGRPL